ncbi:hypothetical protein PC116_g24169 [Phytophthora cactorum]|uniref:Ankyrin repeat-containing domain n=1 Tax=Phytophthora cactorum TaxID=29920 RepID=A0A329RA28_9STRA|nr:hypothetical protein PC113_g20497 [Phytophthora cactorum]KAG2881815.1 hypothetical protein PC117_g26325 [Phytophthora cactorum]KAG2962428.1 hypothetical protein PC119_g25816 [Phytophthora cactorum]KAG2972872.1 hypothetical protein PC120_g26239 [Phytophthora cactorum]KAG3031805.1 hypothetical protein PC121_g24436 [Phytophthora cactorum]
MNLAAGQGQLEVMQWLHSHGCKGTYEATDNVVGKGRLDIVKWLYDRGYNGSSEAIAAAVIFGYLDMLQWFYENTGKVPQVDAVSLAIESNRLNVLRWLKDMDLLKKVRGGSIRWRFSSSQSLETIAWIHLNTPAVYTSEAMEDFASKGDLSAIKWMALYRGERLCTHKVIRNAIHSGSLSLVRWLLEHFIQAECWPGPLSPRWSLRHRGVPS